MISVNPSFMLLLSSPSHHDLSPLRVLLAGGTAGIFNWLSCIAQDTLKSRYQIGECYIILLTNSLAGYVLPHLCTIQLLYGYYISYDIT